MVDFLGMMKKAEELQSKMATMQEQLGQLVVEGVSGGGLVVVSLSGKGEMKGLKIDPSLFKEDDVEVLEDLIVTAHNDAKAKAESATQKAMSEATAGLQLPPGMKLPF
ncbi:MAG: YbaB/EbfC family nucleoid-associated protein [Devosia nanyangense]|uniref:Nucleoid-associated protein HY834_05355 n=1 Tax=Devosia nanyangense TaxID=1228055 RepID=A0A933NXF5_9HYPH|nr:YbaB/EbfC family nucleoid-associated protein [Devosia nanyangense]